MADSVRIQMLATSQNAVNAVRQFTNEVRRLEQQFRRTGQAGAMGGRTAAAGFSRASDSIRQTITGLLGIATPLAAITTTLGVIRNEITQIQEQGRRASERLVTRDIARLDAIAALDVAEVPVGEFDQIIAGISRRTAARESVTFRAAQDVLAARGTFPTREALGALETSAETLRGRAIAGDADALAKFATGILQVRRFDPEISNEQAAAVVLGGFKTARTTDIASFARFLLPQAVIATEQGLAGMDVTPEQRREEFLRNMATLTQITNVIQDVTSRQTTTAAINARMRAAEFLAERGMRVFPSQAPQIIGADPELRREFLGLQDPTLLDPDELRRTAEKFGSGQLRGELRARGAIASLFVPGSQLNQQIEEAIEIQGRFDEQTTERFKNSLEEAISDPENLPGRLREAITNMEDVAARRSLDLAVREDILQLLQNTFEAIGAGPFRRSLLRTEQTTQRIISGRVTPEEEIQFGIERLQEQAENQRFVERVADNAERQELAKQNAELIEAQIKILTEILEAVQAGNLELTEQTLDVVIQGDNRPNQQAPEPAAANAIED